MWSNDYKHFDLDQSADGTLPNLLGIGLLWRQLERLRRASAPRMFAGCVVAFFGIYALLNTMQPAASAGDGLLYYFIRGLGSLLP